MVENGELRCPNCNVEIDSNLDEWMMQDGETRRFRCDECGWNQRYGVANRLRALGEDGLADMLAYEGVRC